MRIRFYLRDLKAKNSTMIFASVHFRTHRIKLTTEISINPRHWSAEKGRAKRGYLHEGLVNKRLDEIELEIAAGYMKLTSDGARPTAVELKSFLRPQVVEAPAAAPDPSILEVLDDFLQDSKATLRPATLMIYKTLRAQIVEYQKINCVFR